MALNNYCFGPDQVLPAFTFKTCDIDGAINLRVTQTGPGSNLPVSIYTMFKGIAERHSEKPAMAVKIGSHWRHWSYSEYFEECCTVAKAFIKLGLERFHGVCIMGYNSPQWFMAHLGCIFAGGVCTGVYTTNSPEACRYLADSCKAQIVVVENETLLRKFLAVKRFLPHIKAIIQWNGEIEAPGVITWEALLEIGRTEDDAQLKRRLALSAVNQCCTLIFTSGTTGPPKGVMCSQDQITWTIQRFRDFYGFGEGETEVRMVSYLPLSHSAGILNDIYFALSTVGVIYFASPDALKGSLIHTLKEVQPTHFFGVPRIWEKLYEGIQGASQQAGYLKRSLASWANAQGRNYYLSVKDGREFSKLEDLKYSLANSLVFNKVKTALGLSKIDKVGSGTAPIAVEILEFLAGMGIPILEIYGLSETTSLCTLSEFESGRFRFGAVGKVVEPTEVLLLDVDERRKGEGEICIKGRNIFMGYLNMSDKTEEAIDDEGWLHTGDIGYLDEDGFLYITGRLKELVITAGGENIPPVLIENQIKNELPVISNAMLIGDKRKYLTILLTLKSEVDLETAMPLDHLTPTCINLLQSIGSQAKTVTEARQEIMNDPNCLLAKAIDQGIKRYNTIATSNAQKVQKWTILEHDFSLPTEELNNTLKMKRAFIQQKYTDVIEAMYNSESQIQSKL